MATTAKGKDAAGIAPARDARLEKLPLTCTLKEINERNRAFWERNVRSFPPLGEAAVKAKV